MDEEYSLILLVGIIIGILLMLLVFYLPHALNILLRAAHVW